MLDQRLRERLEELRAELGRAESTDGREQRMLRGLEADVEELLAREADHPRQYDGLGERLREAVAQLDRPLSTSRSRRRPDTPPAWRLTGDSEGSTVYGKEEVCKEGEEAPRIRFQDERAARAEREGEVGAVVSALQAALRR